MMRRLLFLLCAIAAGGVVCASPVLAQTVLLSENFDGLDLNPNFWEPDGSGPGTGLATRPDAYTHTPPSGWTNDRSLVPTLPYPQVGVPEWEGWSFTNKDWWAAVAGGQGRQDFANAIGTVAVIDGDEWDDRRDPSGISPSEYGFLEGSLFTPAIDISSIAPGTGQLTFDSSWRDEDTQAAQVNVSFDGGTTYQTILEWSSDSGSAYFHDDATNEAVVVPFTQPVGTAQAIFQFRGYNMTDDWWWAIDNVAVGAAGSSPVFTEDFESCVLGPPAWEPSGAGENPVVVEEAFTHDGPDGWTIENDIPDGGVEEWRGWSFANKEFWIQVAGDQNRSFYTLGQNTIAVADPDEWDDTSRGPGTYNTTLITPTLNVAGYDRGEMAFDSGWRPEDDQKARLVAEFGNGATEELLFWNSYSGDANFKPDAENEFLSFSVDVPKSAGTVKFKFSLFDAGNDWWWAIDNVVVTAFGTGGGPLDGDLNEDGFVNSSDLDIVRANWGQSVEAGCLACGDANNDGLVNSADLDIIRANWGASAAASVVPEPAGLLLLALGLGCWMLRRRGM